MCILTAIHSEKHCLSSVKQFFDVCLPRCLFHGSLYQRFEDILHFRKSLILGAKESNFLCATTNNMSPHSELSVTQSTYLIQCGGQDVEAVPCCCD